MSKFIPNSFQVPNALVDEALEKISGNAAKAYLLIVRKTRGWQKETDAISLSQFEKIGMSRKTILAAIDELVSVGLVSKTSGPKGVNVFSLNDADWCKNYTSEESTLVENLHQTSVKTTPVTGVKITHTKDTIKNTPKKTHTAKKKSDQSELEARFEKFWSAYPRKVAKPKAKAAFLKHSPDDAMLEAMLNAITAASQRDDWARDDYRYCPHPTTWLNQQRWTDEPVQAPSPTPAPVTAPKPRTDIVSPERRAERVAMLRAAMIGKWVH